MQEAVNVYRGIVRSSAGVDAHLHTIVIHGLIKSGHFHQAMGLFRVAAAEKFPLDVVSYSVAIDGLIRGGQMEKACALFNQMIEVDLAPNGQIYNLMLSGFCKFGNINMIKHVVQEMVCRNIELDRHTYQSMNDLLCSSSNSHVVFSLLLELRNLGLLPKDEQLILVNGHDHSAHANFCSSSVSAYALNVSASSCDDLLDYVASGAEYLRSLFFPPSVRCHAHEATVYIRRRGKAEVEATLYKLWGSAHDKKSCGKAFPHKVDWQTYYARWPDENIERDL